MATPPRAMPIFATTFDLLAWLLRATNHFPPSVRHSFTSRLLSAAFDLRERLDEANVRRGGRRTERLQAADEALARLRPYIRLAVDLSWFTARQYEHVSKMIDEVGRLIGGWQRATSAGDLVPRESARGGDA